MNRIVLAALLTSVCVTGAFAQGMIPGAGGTVGIPDGSDITQGAKADAPCTSGSTTPCSVEARLAHMENLMAGAIPAGTAIIGKTGIDQTTPGTTNGVQVNAALPVGTNTIGNVNSAVNVTPTDCSSTVTTGATSQNAIAAQTTLHGFTIANIDASAGSGEPLWISFTGTASASTGSFPLAAPTATTFAGLTSFTTPPGFGTNHAVSIFAATTGHKFSCTWW